MNKNLVAVVPVRKGSQRVKNKNIRLFAGQNLLIHKIKILKKIKFIDKIIINTDSEQAIKIAKNLMLVLKKDKNTMQAPSVRIVNFGNILQKLQIVNI